MTGITPFNQLGLPPEELFVKAILDGTGGAPPVSAITPDKLTRFATSDRRGDESGWCKLFPDGEGGVYGCWRQGISETWQARQPRASEDRTAFLERVKKAREEAAKIEADRRAECRAWSATTWENAKPATDDHPYLKRKGIQAHDLKLFKESLIVQVQDLDGTIHGLQFIAPDGTKKFKTGTDKTGHYAKIGKSKEKTVIICEGWATGASIHMATGHAVVVAFDAGNLLHVARNIRSRCPGFKIIIAADDDHATEGNPGLVKATETAQAVDGFLAKPVFSSIRGPKDTDFNDLHRLEGPESVEACIEAAATVNAVQPATEDPSLTLFENAATFLTEKIKVEYLIHKFFELFTLISITGPSGEGKSFIAIDVACCIATGRPWNGRAVKQGAVLYLAGEGRSGIIRRIMAWLITHNLSPSDLSGFYLSKHTLMMDGSNLDEIISEMAGIDVALIIIDTLARHISGHENDAQDMGQFINHVDHLGKRLNASRITVHHTGHDQTRGRGSTVYNAAIDTGIMCNKGTLTSFKTKDSEPIELVEFKIVPVVIGNDDETGEPITSAVVEYGERSKQQKSSGLTKIERVALEALIKVSANSLSDEVNGRRGALIGDWRQRFYDFRLNTDPDISKAALKKAFERASEALVAKGAVIEEGHTRILVSDDHQREILASMSIENLLQNSQ